MFNENYEKNFSTKEMKFNSFLNKTIILNAKDYYRVNKKRAEIELNILDDENLNKDINEYREYDETLSSQNNALDFIDCIDNIDLCIALKSLSEIEQIVIFLLFKKELRQEDAAQILDICSKSVSRINKRAINKLKKYLEED